MRDKKKRWEASNRRRSETRGRRCRWCHRSDDGVYWSSADVCARCAKQLERQPPCTGCGGPWWLTFGCLTCPVTTPPPRGLRRGPAERTVPCPSCAMPVIIGHLRRHLGSCMIRTRRGWCAPWPLYWRRWVSRRTLYRRSPPPSELVEKWRAHAVVWTRGVYRVRDPFDRRGALRWRTWDDIRQSGRINWHPHDRRRGLHG